MRAPIHRRTHTHHTMRLPYRIPNCIICAVSSTLSPSPPPLSLSLELCLCDFVCVCVCLRLHARHTKRTHKVLLGVRVGVVYVLARRTRVKCAERVHISPTGNGSGSGNGNVDVDWQQATSTATSVEFSDVFCRIHLSRITLGRSERVPRVVAPSPTCHIHIIFFKQPNSIFAGIHPHTHTRRLCAFRTQMRYSGAENDGMCVCVLCVSHVYGAFIVTIYYTPPQRTHMHTVAGNNTRRAHSRA